MFADNSYSRYYKIDTRSISSKTIILLLSDAQFGGINFSVQYYIRDMSVLNKTQNTEVVEWTNCCYYAYCEVDDEVVGYRNYEQKEWTLDSTRMLHGS